MSGLKIMRNALPAVIGARPIRLYFGHSRTIHKILCHRGDTLSF